MTAISPQAGIVAAPVADTSHAVARVGQPRPRG